MGRRRRSPPPRSGQVHAAEDADGRRLAVKVQYPGVAESLRDDLSSASLLRRVVGDELGERRRRRGARGHARAAPRRARLRRRGGAGSSASAAPSAADATIVIPRVDAARSTARVLTMERLDGRALADLAADDAEARRAPRARHLPLRVRRPLAARHLQRRSAPRQLPGPRRRAASASSTSARRPSCRDEHARRRPPLFLAMIHRDGETLRHAAHEEGLVGRRRASSRARPGASGRRLLSTPFLTRGECTLSPAHVARLITLHRRALARAAHRAAAGGDPACGGSGWARSPSSRRCRRGSTSAACWPSCSTTAATRSLLYDRWR